MKWNGKRVSAAPLVCAAVLAALMSCSTSFLSGNNSGTVESDLGNSLGYADISRLGYMGGSLMYNGASGHLQQNATIAVRLGQVSKEIVDETRAVFTDLPDQAVFGVLRIETVNADSVSFTASLYTGRGEIIESRSFSLERGATVDIDFDGNPDLEYAQPAIKRPGFEKSVYLNFLSSQETLNTAMFSVIPEQYSRSAYPNGIIGINPNGRFIVRKYADQANSVRSMVSGLQTGDFVLDTETGSYQRVRSSSTSRSARAIDDSELENLEETSLPQTFTFTTDEFILTGLDAAVLFDSLPATITAQYSAITGDVERLNAVLSSPDLIPAVQRISSTPIPAESVDAVLAQISSLSEDELARLNRTFLEEMYPDLCPRLQNVSTCFTEVLPLSSVLFGSDEIDSSSSGSGEGRVLTASIYESERAAIRSDFAKYTEFYRQNLASPPVSASGGTARVVFNNSYFALGFKGSFSSTWGSVFSSVEGAVLISVDTDINSTLSYNRDLCTLPPFQQTFPVFAYGPIVLSLNASIDFNLPLSITVPVETGFGLRAAFTGLYGAGFQVGLGYGVEWKKAWIISYPAPYANWTGSTSSIKKSTYFVGAQTPGGVTSAGIITTLTPNVVACVGADITKVVVGDISAQAGLPATLKITYTAPDLVGNATLDFFCNLNANAFIGLKDLPIIGTLGKSWTWPIYASGNQRLASWQVFKTRL